MPGRLVVLFPLEKRDNNNINNNNNRGRSIGVCFVEGRTCRAVLPRRHRLGRQGALFTSRPHGKGKGSNNNNNSNNNNDGKGKGRIASCMSLHLGSYLYH
ncbi:unnamed protein product [Polarella glacialis]|uniref:Uncharacterized protein n=1 Tax=Polarella glacialis TaxID=89957 RepID=A0A813IPE4_POLGL|nr:unnamed protein product [Polarella glacialis]